LCGKHARGDERRLARQGHPGRLPAHEQRECKVAEPACRAGDKQREDARSLDAATIETVAYYICPNCKQRSVDIDGVEGFSKQAVACRSCGFGFLFELLEDYYPAPSTGFVVCDAESRVLAVGRDVFELTGFGEQDVMGREVIEAFGLTGFEEAQNPVALVREWGVRRLGEQLELRTRAGLTQRVTGDFFPAYDEDGGLLVALTRR
jgi:hypothetical protein